MDQTTLMGRQWFALHTLAGREQKAADAIRLRVAEAKLWLLLGLASGCGVDSGFKASDVQEEVIQVSLDEDGPAGFSAEDVLIMVGSREYGAVALPQGGHDAITNLVEHAPFRIEVDTEGVQAFVVQRFVGETLKNEVLRLDVQVAVTSSDSEVAVTGPQRLLATELSEQGVTWSSDEGRKIATGVVPEWLLPAAESLSSEYDCVQQAGEPQIWTLAEPGAALEGDLSEPSLYVGVLWTGDSSPCNEFAVVDAVSLSPAAP